MRRKLVSINSDSQEAGTAKPGMGFGPGALLLGAARLVIRSGLMTTAIQYSGYKAADAFLVEYLCCYRETNRSQVNEGSEPMPTGTLAWCALGAVVMAGMLAIIGGAVVYLVGRGIWGR